jgi:hypothetical protein
MRSACTPSRQRRPAAGQRRFCGRERHNGWRPARVANRGYIVSDDGTELLREMAEDFEGNIEPESKDDLKGDSLEAETDDVPEPVPQRDDACGPSSKSWRDSRLGQQLSATTARHGGCSTLCESSGNAGTRDLERGRRSSSQSRSLRRTPLDAAKGLHSNRRRA